MRTQTAQTINSWALKEHRLVDRTVGWIERSCSMSSNNEQHVVLRLAELEQQQQQKHANKSQKSMGANDQSMPPMILARGHSTQIANH